MNNRRLITEHERPLTASGFRVMKGEREFITYQRDVTIRVWHQPNPDSYAPHFHSAIEVCVPLLGGCEVAVKGKEYHVQAGEVLFVPSDATHALRMAAGSERYLIIFEHNAAFTMKEFAALRPMLRQQGDMLPVSAMDARGFAPLGTSRRLRGVHAAAKFAVLCAAAGRIRHAGGIVSAQCRQQRGDE